MAFYHVRWNFLAANAKQLSFGMDFETPVSLVSAELQSIADDATTEWLTNVGLFAVDSALQAATVQGFERVQDSAGPPPVAHREPTTTLFTGAGAAAAGTVAGQSVPPQNRLVITLRTALPDRSALGRVYTPPPPESVSDGSGAVTDAATRRTMVEDLAVAVEGSIAPVDVDHVIFSTRYGTQAEVISYVARNGRLDTQRRGATGG